MSGMARLPPIVLFQALPKGAKMDLIVRQAVEGGITEIVSFVSEHSVRRFGEQDRLERWRRIIREARQQSGSPVPTEIQDAGDTAGALRYWEALRAGREGVVGILLHVPPEQGKKDPLEQGTFHGYLDREPVLVAAVIGPEGGFSPEEARKFVAAGFRPASLGTTVLRTETAALYAAAAIRIVLLESPSWIYKPH
jgi:16S rRNA (uracil1498-N3)-methyltransferase